MISEKQKKNLETINGKEYLIDKDKKGRNKILVFTLDDGTKLTIKMLADILKCAESCARARLRASSDPKTVFQKVRKIQGRTRQTNNVAHLMDARDWYKDPMIKLLMKNI
jgi:hypothetical protein